MQIPVGGLFSFRSRPRGCFTWFPLGAFGAPLVLSFDPISQRGRPGERMTEAWTRWVGQFIDGRFPLQKCLGGGSHSAVFLTEYREPALRKAAIKLVPASSNATEILDQWEFAAKLSHPHLIRVFESGRCKIGSMDLLYLVMEYADENLSQILPERALTKEETSEMLGPVLDTLFYLHENGLAHGHVRPSNILAADDHLKLSSDSICSAGKVPTATGEEPDDYAAPEIVAQGRLAASDVWSLGITLTEVLTQKRPGKSNGNSSKALPVPFGEIVDHCLQHDPGERWNVAEIQTRLTTGASPRRAAAAVLETPLPRQHVAAKSQKASTSQRYAIPVVAALFLLLVFVVPKLFNRSEPTIRTTSAAAPDTAPPTAKTPPAPRIAPVAPAASSGTKPTPPAPPVAKSQPAFAARVGEVVRQVLPNVPASARATIRGTLRVGVKVEVDEEGSVASAELDSGGPSKYFARLALQAAQDWKFSPPSIDGKNAASEWLLRFAFTSNDTNVSPRQTSP